MARILIAVGIAAAGVMLVCGPALADSTATSVSDHRSCERFVVATSLELDSFIHDLRKLSQDMADRPLSGFAPAAHGSAPYFYSVLTWHGEKPQAYLRV